MKKIFAFTAAIVLALMFVSSCVHISSAVDNDQPTQVKTAGELKVMEQFSRINFTGSMQVVYSHGDKYTVRVEAPQEIMEKLVIYVKSKELNIGNKNEFFGIGSTMSMGDVKIYVTSPVVKQIDLTGTGNLIVNGDVTASRLDVDLTGAGNISFAGLLSCSFLDVELTGSGNIEFANVKADKIDAQVTGVGNINYTNVEAGTVGSNITGAGNITISGTAGNHIQNVTGVGKVDDTGLKVGKLVA